MHILLVICCTFYIARDVPSQQELEWAATKQRLRQESAELVKSSVELAKKLQAKQDFGKPLRRGPKPPLSPEAKRESEEMIKSLEEVMRQLHR